MTHLQRAAMASKPLTEAKVRAIYRRWRFASNTGAVEIGKLCESHERLRAELQGAEILIAENEKRIRELESLVNAQAKHFALRADKPVDPNCKLKLFSHREQGIACAGCWPEANK